MADTETSLAFTPDMPGVTGGSNGPAVVAPKAALEAAIVFNRPHAEFTLPGGRVIYVYSKSEGQLRLIDRAIFEWIAAENKAETRLNATKSRWQFWRRGKVDAALSDAQAAKYALFCRVLEENHIPECDQDLSADEFLTFTPELETAIFEAYRAANDIEAIVNALFGTSKKKVLNQPHHLPSG